MTFSSQQFESYVPVYDTVPEQWPEARQFLVEHLKKISNAVNVREIGFFLDEELLSGKAFIPGATIPGDNPGQFRQILRKVVDCSPLVPGVNSIPHGITFDSNFTLINYWVAGTNSTAFTAINLVNPEVRMSVTNIIINSPGSYDRTFFVCEYTQEL